MFEILLSKPVLIGIHLGFAIIGIDALLWLLGEIKSKSRKRPRVLTALIGLVSFIVSWIAGGYYYVKFYGPLVKPVIKAGLAPWAHGVVMETKEHIFLFIIPMVMTILFATLLKDEEWESLRLKKPVMCLVAYAAGLGLLIGLMGYIISAAARWG